VEQSKRIKIAYWAENNRSLEIWNSRLNSEQMANLSCRRYARCVAVFLHRGRRHLCPVQHRRIHPHVSPTFIQLSLSVFFSRVYVVCFFFLYWLVLGRRRKRKGYLIGKWFYWIRSKSRRSISLLSGRPFRRKLKRHPIETI